MHILLTASQVDEATSLIGGLAERSREIVKALVTADKSVSYVEVVSRHGHDAFLMTDEVYMAAMRAYLTRVAEECAA